MDEEKKESYWDKIQPYISYVLPDDRKRIEEGNISEKEFNKIYKEAMDDEYDHGIIHATNIAREERKRRENQ